VERAVAVRLVRLAFQAVVRELLVKVVLGLVVLEGMAETLLFKAQLTEIV
jgi:hypothetical protein